METSSYNTLEEIRLGFEVNGEVNRLHIENWGFSQVWAALNEGLVTSLSIKNQFVRRYGDNGASRYEAWQRAVFDSSAESDAVLSHGHGTAFVVEAPSFESAFGFKKESERVTRVLSNNGERYTGLGMSYEAIGFLLEGRVLSTGILFENREFFDGVIEKYFANMNRNDVLRSAETSTVVDRTLQAQEHLLRHYFSYPIEKTITVNGGNKGRLPKITKALFPQNSKVEHSTVYEEYYKGDSGEGLTQEAILELYKQGVLTKEQVGYDPVRRRLLGGLAALTGILATGVGVGTIVSAVESFAKGQNPEDVMLDSGLNQEQIDAITHGEVTLEDLEQQMHESGFDEEAIEKIKEAFEDMGHHESHEISSANLATAVMVTGVLAVQVGRILANKEDASHDEHDTGNSETTGLKSRLASLLKPLPGFNAETAKLVWGAEVARMFVLGFADRTALLHDIEEHKGGFAPFPILVILAEVLSRTELDLRKRMKVGEETIDFSDLMPQADQQGEIDEKAQQVLSYRVAQRINKQIIQRVKNDQRYLKVSDEVLGFTPEEIVAFEETGETTESPLLRVQDADLTQYDTEGLSKLISIQEQKLADYFGTVTGLSAGTGMILTPYASVILMNLGQRNIAEELVKLNYLKEYKESLQESNGDHGSVRKNLLAIRAFASMSNAMNGRMLGLDKFTMVMQGNASGKPVLPFGVTPSDFPNVYFALNHPGMLMSHGEAGIMLTIGNMIAQSALWMRSAGISIGGMMHAEKATVTAYADAFVGVASDIAEYSADQINPNKRAARVANAFDDFAKAQTPEEVQMATDNLREAIERTRLSIYPIGEIVKEKAGLVSDWGMKTKLRSIGDPIASLIGFAVPDKPHIRRRETSHGETYVDIVTTRIMSLMQDSWQEDPEVAQIMEKQATVGIRRLVDLMVSVKDGDGAAVFAHHRALADTHEIDLATDVYVDMVQDRQRAESIRAKLSGSQISDVDQQEAEDYIFNHPASRLLGPDYQAKMRIALDAFYAYKKNRRADEYKDAHFGTLGLSHNAEEVFFAILSQLPAVPSMVTIANKMIPVIAGVESGKLPSIAQVKTMVVTTMVVESVISAIADNVAAYLFGEKFLSSQTDPLINAAIEANLMEEPGANEIKTAFYSMTAHTAISAGTLAEAGNGPNWGTIVYRLLGSDAEKLSDSEWLNSLSEKEAQQYFDSLRQKFVNLKMPDSVATAYALVDVGSTNALMFKWISDKLNKHEQALTAARDMAAQESSH